MKTVTLHSCISLVTRNTFIMWAERSYFTPPLSQIPVYISYISCYSLLTLSSRWFWFFMYDNTSRWTASTTEYPFFLMIWSPFCRTDMYTESWCRTLKFSPQHNDIVLQHPVTLFHLLQSLFSLMCKHLLTLKVLKLVCCDP
jgi:hypothetical protein